MPSQYDFYLIPHKDIKVQKTKCRYAYKTIRLYKEDTKIYNTRPQQL